MIMADKTKEQSVEELKTCYYDYELPPGFIAQEPLPERDKARMMVVKRKTGDILHSTVKELPSFLAPGDLLVLNDTRVLPARLQGLKKNTGAKIEVFLLRPLSDDIWETLVRPGKKCPPGTTIFLKNNLQAEIIDRTESGGRIVKFVGNNISREDLLSIGQIPLPPYITKKLTDRERYQTIYAKHEGSVAAPTAGLHFTPALFDSLKKAGVITAFITLHIGLGTFRPVQTENILEHKMHEETYFVPQETAQLIIEAKRRKSKVVAVGTTVCRTLESVANKLENGQSGPFYGNTDLFIYPGFNFKIVEALLTNFHLPRSTLLMLVSAFSSRELILKAYREAISKRYRFYSFGDAMLLL